MHHWEGRPSVHCYLFHSHYNHVKQARLFSQSVLWSPGHKCHTKHTHTLCLCLPCTLAGSLSTWINVVGKHNTDKSWQFYTWFQAAAFKWKSKEMASSRVVVFQLHTAWFHLTVDLLNIGSACLHFCTYTVHACMYACVQLTCCVM